MYGLSIEQHKILLDILRAHEKNIISVKLFGSRARGDNKKNSDVDLAVKFLRPVQALLKANFEDSGFFYDVDIINYDAVKNKELLKNIDREGKLLFISQEAALMNKSERLNLNQNNFSRALIKLREALTNDINDNDLFLDGIIQRFEFCFELAWKLLKAFLNYEGIEANSPRSSIRGALKTGIIFDAEGWFDMLDKRNLSSHTYDEETAREIYNNIAQKYIKLFTDLQKELNKSIK